MSEEGLQKMSANQLIDLMVESVNELLELHRKRDMENAVQKTKEVKLIQQVIAEKRIELLVRI